MVSELNHFYFEVNYYNFIILAIIFIIRISFIGHSLGGLIIRAALPHLSKYQDRFYSYVSLSSPHLGYISNSNKVIDTGNNI